MNQESRKKGKIYLEAMKSGKSFFFVFLLVIPFPGFPGFQIQPSMFLTHLECTACGLRHDWSRLQNLCTVCSKPLFAVYDLAALRELDCLKHSSLREREKSLWRYRKLLPLAKDAEAISLGEGGTPLLRAKAFADDVDLWINDESLNPTQSFKARGMSVAVSMEKFLGAKKLVVPSAGNAG